MSTTPGENEVYWPRVKEILDNCMERWKERWEREPYPGIHEYYWETPQELQASVLNGYRSIEPGLPGRETHLVRSLLRGCGTFGKMPLRGPFVPRSEVDEIVAWIDAGMPEGPPEEWPVRGSRAQPRRTGRRRGQGDGKHTAGVDDQLRRCFCSGQPTRDRG